MNHPKERVDRNRTTIPQPDPAALQACIQAAKESYANRSIPKYETSWYRRMLRTFSFIPLQTWALQLGCYGLLYAGSFFVLLDPSAHMQSLSFSYLLFGACVFSAASLFHRVHAAYYGMSELEACSPCSMQAYEPLRMLVLSLCGCVFLTLMAARIAYRISLNFTALMYGGCIPFLMLNALAVWMQGRHISRKAELAAYIIALVVLALADLAFAGRLFVLFQEGCLVLMVLLSVCLGVQIARNAKDHPLLW